MKRYYFNRENVALMPVASPLRPPFRLRQRASRNINVLWKSGLPVRVTREFLH